MFKVGDGSGIQTLTSSLNVLWSLSDAKLFLKSEKWLNYLSRYLEPSLAKKQLFFPFSRFRIRRHNTTCSVVEYLQKVHIHIHHMHIIFQRISLWKFALNLNTVCVNLNNFEGKKYDFSLQRWEWQGEWDIYMEITIQ